MRNKAYPTDLTDDQRKILDPLLPKPKGRGRRILNGLFYLDHAGDVPDDARSSGN